MPFPSARHMAWMDGLTGLRKQEVGPTIWARMQDVMDPSRGISAMPGWWEGKPSGLGKSGQFEKKLIKKEGLNELGPHLGGHGLIAP